MALAEVQKVVHEQKTVKIIQLACPVLLSLGGTCFCGFFGGGGLSCRKAPHTNSTNFVCENSNTFLQVVKQPCVGELVTMRWQQLARTR